MERQDLSCKYLAHHELESDMIIFYYYLIGKIVGHHADAAAEGSPKGAGNQIEEGEDKGYNPLVPGRVVYIYR